MAAGEHVKDWLQDLYEGFTPEWFFRVGGVLTLIYMALGNAWPWSDGSATPLPYAVLWLYAAWGAVEIIKLLIED